MSQLVQLSWPLGGLVKSSALASQPEGTTPDCLNVRAYDSLDRRARGGRRAGLSKFVPDAPSGDAIQLLRSQVAAVEISEDAGFGDKFSDPGTAMSGRWADAIEFHPDGQVVAIATWDTGDPRVQFYEWDTETGFGDRIQLSDDLGHTGVGVIDFNHDGTAVVVCDSPGTNNWFRVAPFSTSSGAGTYVEVDSPTNEGWAWAAWHPTTNILFVTWWDEDIDTIYLRAYEWDGSSLTVVDTTNSGTVPFGGSAHVGVLVHPDGDRIVWWGSSDIYSTAWDGSSFGSTVYTDTVLGQMPRTTFSRDGTVLFYAVGTDLRAKTYNKTTGVSDSIADELVLSSNIQALAMHPTQDLVCVGVFDSPYVGAVPWTGSWGTPLDDPATLPAEYGTDVAVHPGGRNVGVAIHGSPYATVYEFTPAQTNPSAREQRVVAVAGGSVYRSLTDFSAWVLTNSGEDVLAVGGRLDGVQVLQKMFFCDRTADGYVYLDYADNTVKDWESDVTAGSLPVGTDDTSLACNICVLYRGRVVMAGLKEEPQNWFMSKSGDPFDWDYSPSTSSAIQAVAGNNSNAGELGDVLTALAPYQDDVMVMGGANTLWLMRGDPAAGGSIDNLSRQIGIVGPDAWTWDSYGNFYFVGINGLYRLTPGAGMPELVSRDKLDKVFNDIDLSTDQVRLVYDPFYQGVHVFISPPTQPDAARRHYFYDERTDSFWPDEYPAAHGPSAVLFFADDDPGQTAVLLGGYDGYVRQVDDSATDDDGTDITSRLRFTPLYPAGAFGFARLDDLQFVLDQQSDDVTMQVWAGDTVEEAGRLADAAGTPAFTRTLKGGRNTTIRHRRADGAFLIELSQVGGNWAYEAGGGRLQVVNRLRGRHVS